MSRATFLGYWVDIPGRVWCGLFGNNQFDSYHKVATAFTNS